MDVGRHKVDCEDDGLLGISETRYGDISHGHGHGEHHDEVDAATRASAQYLNVYDRCRLTEAEREACHDDGDQEHHHHVDDSGTGVIQYLPLYEGSPAPQKAGEVCHGGTPHGDDAGEKHVSDKVSLVSQCLRLNEMCQELLERQESSILSLIEACRSEQMAIRENIQLNRTNNNLYTRRSKCYSVFGIPYFKDQTLFPSPPNEDQLEKQSLGYFDPLDLPIMRLWKSNEKKTLEESIRKYEIGILVKKYEDEQREILLRILDCSDVAEKKRLEGDLKEYKTKIANTKKCSLKELLSSEKTKNEYDWMKISAADLKGLHSPDECRSVWFNYLHPSLNKKGWSKAEDDRLKSLASKYECQEWRKIAQELATGRSGYQCLCHFQVRLNDNIKKSQWTEEESENLRKLVDHFQIGSYIPWAKVACYMDGRTKGQVYNHWCYVAKPDIKKGKFRKEEDMLIIVGVEQFGPDFSRIANYFEDRTTIQLRQRYTTLLQSQDRAIRWTTDEDILLLNLTREYGYGNWKEICKHFPSRSGAQVRFRYYAIKRWLLQNPSGMVPVVNSRQPRNPCSLDKMWEEAKRIVNEKKRKLDPNDDGLVKSEDVMSEVRDVLLERNKKRKGGRKQGKPKTLSALDKEYNSFFRCAYAQPGGRSTVGCSKEKIPDIARQVRHMIHTLHGNIVLPEDVNTISKDDDFVPFDKSILEELAADEAHQGAKASSSDSDADRPPHHRACQQQTLPDDGSYLCPPNFSTVVGLRTFLLSRRNLCSTAKLDARGEEGEDDASFDGRTYVAAVRRAFQLWNERLALLFTWPALMSNVAPGHADFTDAGADLAMEMPSDAPSERAGGRPKKKRKKKEAPKKEKRKYVKSGLYKRVETVCEPVRRSLRSSNNKASASNV